LYHSNTDRIAYWDFLEYPNKIPLYGIVIESWWINQDKALELQR
jgi:ABC-type oligopeptide transport system substrate-binding subunit